MTEAINNSTRIRWVKNKFEIVINSERKIDEGEIKEALKKGNFRYADIRVNQAWGY